MCPVCETTLDQSNAPVAERMKLYIRERIAAGDTEDEIKDALVAEFGAGVLAKPPAGGFGLLAWLLPLAGILAGAVVDRRPRALVEPTAPCTGGRAAAGAGARAARGRGAGPLPG